MSHVLSLARSLALLIALCALPAFSGSGAAAAQSSAAGVNGTDTPMVRFEGAVADAKASMLVDPRATIQKAKALQTRIPGLPERDRNAAMATSLWLEGEALLRVDEVRQAGPVIDRALAALGAKPAPTKLLGDILLTRGGYNTAMTNVARALEDYQRAHHVFRDIGQTRSRAIALLSIAGLYQDSTDYQSALKYYAQALDVYQGDPQLQLSIYNNRGIALKELGRISEARVEYDRALALAKSMKSPSLELSILRNVARAALADKDLASADRTVAQGFAIASKLQQDSISAQMWDIAAKAAFMRGRTVEARRMIERSFAGVPLDQTTISYREAHETAYAIYRRLKEERLALAHLEAMKRIDDKATKLAASSNTALAAARFDYANQELRIAKLKADELRRNIAFERSKAETQRFIFIGVAVVTVIIFSMLAYGIVTLRRSRNLVRAANIDLAATNEALGKALAAKTEFLATTSHEIRTPLNGILGMTQVMLADRSLSESVKDRINVVHGAGMTMRALVDDILDVAKMETGNMTIESVPFDLKATLRDVTRMWEEQARGRGIGFRLAMDEGPAWIEGDAGRLRQIVFNLLSNALKFTEAGEVAVTVRAEPGDAPRLSVAVSDSGIGIPADKLELIFESFRQVDAGTTRKFGGTGLGLAICRNLARAMDGDVLVESEPGKGSTFTLQLPLKLAATPAEESPPEPTGQRPLLLLDRSPITRAMMKTLLEPHAGSVLFAATAGEALETIAAGGIGMVLIDEATIKAADDVDAAAAQIVAAARPQDTQVAILWAGLDDARRAAFAGAGIDHVIGKPISGAALCEVLYPDKSASPGEKGIASPAATAQAA